MIVKSGGRLELVLTVETGIDSPLLNKMEMGRNFLLKMDSQAMDHTIPLGMRMKGTCGKGTGESGRGGILGKRVCVFGANMKFQGLLLKKRLWTIRTEIGGGVRLVLLHMIVHGVLTFLCHSTGGANKLTVLVALIHHR